MSAKHPHRFLSLNAHGQVGIFETSGNEDCRVILRGGSAGTNYDAKSVDAACAALTKAGLRPQVMIDFSHANSSSSEEHTSELQSLMRTSYAVFCLKHKTGLRTTTPDKNRHSHNHTRK